MAEEGVAVSVGTCYLLGDKQSHLLSVPLCQAGGGQHVLCLPRVRTVCIQRDKAVLTRCVCKLPLGSVNACPGAEDCVSRPCDGVEQQNISF